MSHLAAIPSQFELEFDAGKRAMNVAARRAGSLSRQLLEYRQTSHTGPSGLYRSGCHANTVDLGARALFHHCMLLLRGKPLEVSPMRSGATRIRVMGVFDYWIDEARRVIYSRPINPALFGVVNEVNGIAFTVPGYESIDVLCPLGRPFWLQFVAFSAGGICARSEVSHVQQEQLWPEIPNSVLLLEQICAKTYAWLRKEPMFRQLRARLGYWLIRTIGSEAVDLALRARTEPYACGLNARDVRRVWQWHRPFERMQRENPKLLTVFNAWLDAVSAPASDMVDAVPLIRDSLLASGLQPRSWRYLACHGARRLRERKSETLQWWRLKETLDHIQKMGWPDLPPVGFLGFLSDTAGLPAEDPRDPLSVPWWFWQWACKEAASCKRDPKHYALLQENLVDWARLVRMHQPVPDANQRRSGLAWLRAWAAQKHFADQFSDQDAWSEWLRQVPWSQVKKLHVVPLLSPRSLVDEARAMRNCADKYLEDCEKEDSILLSLRNPQDGKRVALMGLMRTPEDPDRWELEQIAGPCNRKVAPSIRRVAQELVRLVNAHLQEPNTVFNELMQLAQSMRRPLHTHGEQLELWPGN